MAIPLLVLAKASDTLLKLRQRGRSNINLWTSSRLSSDFQGLDCSVTCFGAHCSFVLPMAYVLFVCTAVALFEFVYIVTNILFAKNRLLLVSIKVTCLSNFWKKIYVKIVESGWVKTFDIYTWEYFLPFLYFYLNDCLSVAAIEKEHWYIRNSNNPQIAS